MNKKLKTWLLISLAIICGLGIHFCIRYPALSLTYFHNEDTAGITYSAHLIMQGDLPYIDTVEMKAPGSFFLLAQWWSWFGVSLESAQTLMFMWSFLAACGIALGSWFLYHSIWTAGCSGLLYIYLAPFTDSIDINYGAWMITPYIFAASFLWWIYRDNYQPPPETETHKTNNYSKISWGRKQLTVHLGLGLLIALSALMKRQGAAIFPLALWLVYSVSANKHKALTYLIGGTCIGFTLFFIPYWQKGHLLEGIENYFFSKSGWDYLASNIVETKVNISSKVHKLPRLWDGIVGTPIHLPIGTALSSLVLVYTLVERWQTKQYQENSEMESSDFIDTRLLGYLGIFALLSFTGTALGLRFFKGYYLQMLPALIWIGTYPSVWRRVFTLSRTLLSSKLRTKGLLQKVIIVLFITSLPFALSISWSHLNKARRMRSAPLYLPTMQIREISQEIKANTQREDKIWVWGRWAWPSYFYTERQSATRYFKNLGVLTTQLTNTWNPNRKSLPTRFNPHSPWKEAIKELEANPPQWIICAKNESFRDFKALRQLLSQRYQAVTYQQLRVKTGKKRPLFSVYRLKP